MYRKIATLLLLMPILIIGACEGGKDADLKVFKGQVSEMKNQLKSFKEDPELKKAFSMMTVDLSEKGSAEKKEVSPLDLLDGFVDMYAPRLSKVAQETGTPKDAENLNKVMGAANKVMNSAKDAVVGVWKEMEDLGISKNLLEAKDAILQMAKEKAELAPLLSACDAINKGENPLLVCKNLQQSLGQIDFKNYLKDLEPHIKAMAEPIRIRYGTSWNMNDAASLEASLELVGTWADIQLKKVGSQFEQNKILGELFEGTEFSKGFLEGLGKEFQSELMMMGLVGRQVDPDQFGAMGAGGFDAQGPADFSTMNMGSVGGQETSGRFGMKGTKPDGPGRPAGHASAMGTDGFEVQGSGRFGSTSKGFSLGKGSLESGRGDDSFDIKSFPGSDRW